MNNKNCQLCKNYKDGYCKELELKPSYPEKGCDYYTMTLDEAIKHAEEVADYDAYGEKQRRCAEEHRQLAEWLKDYKRLLKQEPCEDCISRARVLSMAITHQYNIKQVSSISKDDVIKKWGDMIDFIENLPPVQPRPKTGHWIEESCGALRRIVCSECGKVPPANVKKPYCPNCSAKMLRMEDL